MNIDNPLLKYAESPEPPKWKRCEHTNCENWLYTGNKYLDAEEGCFCMECAEVYEIEGTIKYARADK